MTSPETLDNGGSNSNTPSASPGNAWNNTWTNNNGSNGEEGASVQNISSDSAPSNSSTLTSVPTSPQAQQQQPDGGGGGGSNGHAKTYLSVGGGGGGGSGGGPKAVLTCRPNSHPFQDRTLGLEQQVKVGRSVARARPAVNNAIFDCKVLSRNHAMLWYENGKFYLQDTKSSNGTFVNNQRLSKGSEESLPREVCSGDILQFGVDVMENSRKVTHGCIIATLKLYLPDGKEAKASPTIMSSPFGSSSHLPAQDLYLLNQYIQEALAREALLETKLSILQRLVGQTEVASGDAWKALIDEDRLLTRVEILESQLSTYGKNMSEDKLREEVQRLIDEKEEYQEMAKETVTKITNEKLGAIHKVGELQKKLESSINEQNMLKELYDKCNDENQRMAEELSKVSTELEEAKNAAAGAEAAAAAAVAATTAAAAAAAATSTAETAAKDETSASSMLEPSLTLSTSVSETPADDNQNQSETSQEQEKQQQQPLNTQAEEVVESKDNEKTSEPCQVDVAEETRVQSEVSEVPPPKVEDIKEEGIAESGTGGGTLESPCQPTSAKWGEIVRLQERVEQLEQENSELRQHRTEAKDTQKEMADGECQTVSNDDGGDTSMLSMGTQVEDLSRQGQNGDGDTPDIEHRLREVQEERDRLEREVERLRSRRTSPEEGSESPEPSEQRLNHLIMVKERYDDVSRTNGELERSLRELETEVESLWSQNQVATACAALPIVVLLLAFIVAYLPTLSSLFGTAEQPS